VVATERILMSSRGRRIDEMTINDRLGDHRGSERESIKFFSEEMNSTMNQCHNHGFPHKLVKATWSQRTY
jgi:hypothetical protein